MIERNSIQKYGNFTIEPEKSARLADDIIERIKQEKLPVGFVKIFLNDLIDELEKTIVVK